jgi:hypothetical protein
MTDIAPATDAVRKQRIRRTAWVLGACAVLAYGAFLFSAMRA